MESDADLVELTTARTAFEAEWLVGALKAMGLPAVTFGEMLADEYAMSQKLLGSSGGLRVMVPRADLERARRALPDALRTRPTSADLEAAPAAPGDDAEQEVGEEAPRVVSGGGGRTAILVLLAAAVVALGCIAFLQYGRLADLQRTNPVTESHWKGDRWEARWRHNGRLASVSLDHDKNHVFEEVRVYDREGTLVVKMFDANQNGVFELAIDVDPSGNERGRSIDADENRIFERYEYPVTNGVQERWVDADEDRRVERHEFVDVRSGQVLYAFEDHGRDGFVRVK